MEEQTTYPKNADSVAIGEAMLELVAWVNAEGKSERFAEIAISPGSLAWGENEAMGGPHAEVKLFTKAGERASKVDTSIPKAIRSALAQFEELAV